MSLGGRIWRVARQELRRRLGMVQGSNFGSGRTARRSTDDARDELNEWLRSEDPPRARARTEPPSGSRSHATMGGQANAGSSNRTNTASGSRSNTSSDSRHAQTSPPPRPYAHEYRTLEAPLGSDLETVRRYWRQAVRKHHPDLYPTGSSEQQAASARLREINTAYDRLKGFLEPGSRTA